ncbi:hypothetical protein JCM19046_2801 [Bacillus sp. JCM 19046]|nr:hypothetical protein JCM19046_2801 [Bacillus sp. JCM 19046]
MRLSQHQHSFVRNQVAEIVWNGAAPYLEESTLTILLERFEKDENLDVRQYAESIREDLNRSYEDWVLSWMIQVNMSQVLSFTKRKAC